MGRGRSSPVEITREQNRNRRNHRQDHAGGDGPVEKDREQKCPDHPETEMKRIGITFSPKIDEGKGKNTEARRGKSRAFGTDQNLVYLVVGLPWDKEIECSNQGKKQEDRGADEKTAPSYRDKKCNAEDAAPDKSETGKYLCGQWNLIFGGDLSRVISRTDKKGVPILRLAQKVVKGDCDNWKAKPKQLCPAASVVRQCVDGKQRQKSDAEIFGQDNGGNEKHRECEKPPAFLIEPANPELDRPNVECQEHDIAHDAGGGDEKGWSEQSKQRRGERNINLRAVVPPDARIAANALFSLNAFGAGRTDWKSRFRQKRWPSVNVPRTAGTAQSRNAA